MSLKPWAYLAYMLFPNYDILFKMDVTLNALTQSWILVKDLDLQMLWELLRLYYKIDTKCHVPSMSRKHMKRDLRILDPTLKSMDIKQR